MHQYIHSAIADGSHFAFDPTQDTLSFSGTGLSAADVQLMMSAAGSSLIVTAAGKSYALDGVGLTSVEGSSFLFDDGSALVNAAADNGYAHDLHGTTHDDLLIGGPPSHAIAAVSSTSSGAAVSESSVTSSISANNRFVSFTSFSDDLSSADANGSRDIYVKDLQAGEVKLVSSNSGGEVALGGLTGSDQSSISATGRFVAFYSEASNLVDRDSNFMVDVFVKDLLTGSVKRASTNAHGDEASGGADGSYSPSISADGRYVAFASDASNLVSGDTNRHSDIFVKDMKTGVIVRASTNAAGAQSTVGDWGSFSPQISADGRYVLFSSDLKALVSSDTDDVIDCFLKDLKTGAITRVASAPDANSIKLSADGRHVAYTQGGDVFTFDVHSHQLVDHGQGTGPTLSADGRYLGFTSSRSDLVPGDTNHQEDAFVKDLLTSEIARVSVNASGTQANGAAGVGSISADGSLLTIVSSATNLVKGFGQSHHDIFIVSNPLDTRTLSGGDGNDTYLIQRTADKIVEAADGGIDTVRSTISLTLADNVEKLVLLGDADLRATGNDERNTLTGNAGSNTLDGGAGADILAGGAGDDTYLVDNASDRLIERADGGIDTVRSSVDAALDANVEVLRLTGSANIDGTGNALDNTIYGNAGNNVLDGKGGVDTASYAGAAGAVEVSLASTTPQATGAAGSDTLKNIENLTGSAYADTLTGNAQANVLDGGAGADHLIGGKGDDIYVIDRAGDVVVEQANAGTDTVRSSVDVTLAANVENLELLGNGALAGTGNALDNVLIGTAGNNRLDGGQGFDTVSYANAKAGVQVSLAISHAQNTDSAGSDLLIHIEALVGSGFDDHLTGSIGDNRLEGGAGNDTLDGGSGADTMIGGAGDDTYIIDQTNDKVSEAVGGGADQVLANVSFRLTAGVETLHLIGTGDIDATGSTDDNLLIGNAGDNRFDGGAGNDTVSYVDANVGVTVSLGANGGQATGGAGHDTLLHVENLIGSSHDDVLSGDAGDNQLDGGAGIDTVSYANASAAVRVSLAVNGIQDTGGAGRDQVINFERLVGSAHDDTLTGNDAANVIDGGKGADRMIGRAGDDHYVVDNADDVVIETASGGHDTVDVLKSWTMSAGVEDAVITGGIVNGNRVNVRGNDLDNTITGNADGNGLDGGAGNDTMVGGDGWDWYAVDSVGDKIVELADEGLDTVYASITWKLGANLEDLSLTGAKAIDATGNALDNMLLGNKAANTLDGGAGADYMEAGYGNDTYIVDDAGDIVVELEARGGHDTVKSSVSFDLKASYYVEDLELTGKAAIDGHGNAEENKITGNSASNLLDGDAGADVLIGGRGNDTYIVDNAHDRVTETAGAGVDNVQASVSWTLGANVENLTLTGSASIAAIGNALNNAIVGNEAANKLTGGGGADTFVFDLDLPSDTVADFKHGVDHLLLDQKAHAIGDGDAHVDGAVKMSKPGGFASSAELVIETSAVHGALTADAAASAIGSAKSAYDRGDSAVFVVGNGHDSAVYLFTSANHDATVSADELHLVASLSGAPSVGASDFIFGG